MSSTLDRLDRFSCSLLTFDETHKQTQTVSLGSMERAIEGEDASSLGRKLYECCSKAEAGPVSEIESLLLNHAAVDWSEDSRTPLSIAAELGHAAVCGMLLDHKADIDSRDSKGISPLHYAALGGDLATCELLLERRANVHAHDEGVCSLFNDVLILWIADV